MYFYIFGFFDSIAVSWTFLGIMVLMNIFYVVAYAIVQYVMTREKLSAIVPYSQLKSAFAIVLAFFIFQDGNIYTLTITLFAIFIVMIVSIDYKNISISRNIIYICIANLMYATNTLFSAYLLQYMDLHLFFTYVCVLYLFVMFIPITLQRIWGQCRYQSWFFYKSRSISAILANCSFFIGMFLIVELGVVLTILVSFVAFATTLIVGYFVLKDVPQYKDMCLSVILLMLV